MDGCIAKPAGLNIHELDAINVLLYVMVGNILYFIR